MALPAFTRSLSARLLALTIVFVMLGEVLIYSPSIGRFRVTWLEEKLAAGHLAALAILAAPEGMVTEELERELLAQVGAYVVDLELPGRSTLMLGRQPIPETDHEVNLAERGFMRLILDAYDTLLRQDDRVLRVEGPSPRDPAAHVVLKIDERPLRVAMRDYSWRILLLSIVLSLICACLMLLSLRWLMVRPLRRFIRALMAFRDNPEDAAAAIRPSGRMDELGVAERELADMQAAVRSALTQKERLAALGTAVAKINHDLRNMLSSAALLSERLSGTSDPGVQKVARPLLAALDRAIDLCSRTLDYTREGAPPLDLAPVPLAPLLDEMRAELNRGPAQLVDAVPPDLKVIADRDQLLRVMVNLGRNAFEAGAEHLTIRAAARDGGVEMLFIDDGPGLPPRARDHLFQPFAGRARPGGTGLGLAIVREIAAAHRGTIRLIETGARGTVFGLTLPAG